MDNNSESQKNLSEINVATAADVSDSKSDPPPGSSPKKPIQLGVVQSSLGNRNSTSSFNKKSRWDQAPESGEETETKESKTELQDAEHSTNVKNLIQKFENITGDSHSLEKQSEELAIKPVAPQTPSRVKLVRTNFMKIDKPTQILDKTSTDDTVTSSFQQNDNILKQLTPQTSTTEVTEIKDIKSVTPSTALEIISSCYDSPSDESSQDTDISSTSRNKSKDSVSLEKLNHPLKDDTTIESKSNICTESVVTSEIKMDTDIQLNEELSCRSKVSSKEDGVDFVDVAFGDASSYTQSLSGKNTPIEDGMNERTRPSNIKNTKNDVNSKINLSSVDELLPQSSTLVIHEITSDPLTKSSGDLTVSSKVLYHTQKSELANPATNKEDKFQDLNEDSPNKVIGNNDGDLSELSKNLQEETISPPNISKLVDMPTTQEIICSIDLPEKSETDEHKNKLLSHITPTTENISSEDQLETGESKTDIKTSLVEENFSLHMKITEGKTDSNVDRGQNNILKTVDLSLKTPEGNNASVLSVGSFNESSSKISGAESNSKDQIPSSSSLTCNELEKQECSELSVNVRKAPVIEELCVKKHMYITGDNSNISEVNLNENKDILRDAIESNTTENISLYNDGVDATMEKMFSDNLESGDEILAPVEESNKDDIILSQSIKSPKVSVLTEEILSTNENKEASCFESNKNESIETSDSLLEMLESESSPSCNDTKKDIQHHTKLHIPITETNTLREPDILTKTLLDTFSEESCISSEENILITNENNLKEVETTSEQQEITRINVEDSLKSVNIETTDIEKCEQDNSKMSSPNVPEYKASVESLVHKDIVLLSPERSNDSLNAEVTEHVNKQPVSFDQSEKAEESIMLEYSESSEELPKTELQEETKKDVPSIKSNILKSEEKGANDSLIYLEDNQLNRVIKSTEIDTQLNSTPCKIEAESKVRKPDSNQEKLTEDKHTLRNIEQNEEFLERIIEDTEMYETSASTHFSSSDKVLVKEDTQKSNYVKDNEKIVEVSTTVKETINEQCSDTSIVCSEDYDLPLNEHSENMSHKETEKENTDVLLTDENEMEEIESQHFVERPTKEVMSPTIEDSTVVAVKNELSFQTDLKSNNEENGDSLTVETSELINNAIIDNKSLSSLETLEVNKDISLEGNKEVDSESKIDIKIGKHNICNATEDNNLTPIEKCETLETEKLVKNTSCNLSDKTYSSEQHLVNLDSSIEGKLQSVPEKNNTSKINPLVNSANNEHSLLNLTETGNLSICEAIETEISKVNTLDGEIKNIEHTTSLNTELDDSRNTLLQKTTVDIEENKQQREIETSMGEETVNCSEIILKGESDDCKGMVTEIKIVTEPKPDVPLLVSTKGVSRKIALESNLNLENKSMYDFDKPTCSGEGDSEANITDEAEVKQVIPINESYRIEECLQLKSADKDQIHDSKDKVNMSLDYSNKEEIDENMITKVVKSKTDSESLAVVVTEDVYCEQHVTSPKENVSFDHKERIDTKTDLIMDSNQEKYLAKGSHSSSHIEMENCQVMNIKHSAESDSDRKLSPVVQPDKNVDLFELDNLSEQSSNKCLDEEENLDKLIPDVSKDKTEIICDDSEAETIQAIDLFLQDTDSENKDKSEPKTNENDDKTEITVSDDSCDNTIQKIEDVDMDSSIELGENPLESTERDSERNKNYLETSQEEEKLSKDKTVQKQHENVRDSFSDEEIFDQSPNMGSNQEICQTTGNSHKEEHGYKAAEHVISNHDNASGKENTLEELISIQKCEHEEESFVKEKISENVNKLMEINTKSTDIEIQEDKKQKKEICHSDIESINKCEVELAQESKLEQSETVLEVALKNFDSSNKQVNTPTEVFKKTLRKNDQLTQDVSKDSSNLFVADVNKIKSLPLVENQGQKLKPDVKQQVLVMSLEMPMSSTIDTSDSQFDNNPKETLTVNENNEFPENIDIPASNKTCMQDAKVIPAEEIKEISMIDSPVEEEQVAETDNINELNKELPDKVPVTVVDDIKNSEQTTTRSDEAAVIESEDNNLSTSSVENKPEVKPIEKTMVILNTETLIEEENVADTTINVTDNIIEQNKVLPDKLPIIVEDGNKNNKQTTPESGETLNINAGYNSPSISSVSLDEIKEVPKTETDVEEKTVSDTTSNVTFNINEQNQILNDKLPLIPMNDNKSNKQTTPGSNEAPVINAGDNKSTSSSIANKPEVKPFEEEVKELPNTEILIEEGKGTDITSNVTSDINEQSKVLPDKLQITVESDVKSNKQRIPRSDEASLINNSNNPSTSSVVDEPEVNSVEEIKVKLMTDTPVEEKNVSDATKNSVICDIIEINKILPDKLPITVVDIRSNKEIKAEKDQAHVINSGENKSSTSSIENKTEVKAVEEIKVLSQPDKPTDEETVFDTPNVIDNIEEQNKELPDKVKITVVEDIKNNEQITLRSDESAVIESEDNISSNSSIENQSQVKPVDERSETLNTETLIEEEIVADTTNNFTDDINEQNKLLSDKLPISVEDGSKINKQTTPDSGDALDTNSGNNSSILSALNEPEVKSPKEMPKTETYIKEEKVDGTTNNATGNINEQNQILRDKLPLLAMDNNTSYKQATSGSDETPEINTGDNNSTISKQSRKRQKKSPSLPDDSDESKELSPPKKEARTDDLLCSSNEFPSEDTNKLPPLDSEPPTKVTKSPAVKEVPAPVRVSARQKQRQAAAAAALAAKSSPEIVSKKVLTQEKSGDKRVKKSLSPTKELQIKISSSKPEVEKQSPIVCQKSPKDIDTKQSSQISPKKMLKQLGQDKLEPITLKLSKEENPVIVRSSSLSPKKVLSPLSPQTKTLGYTLKINKDSTKIVPKDSTASPNTRDASPSSSNPKADLSGKVGYLIKDTGLTITPIAPAETQDQKLSKITLKLSKAGGHPEIKQEKSETWKAIQKLGEIDIVPVEGKPSPECSKRKEKLDQESPEKKLKLGDVTVEPSSSGMSKLQGLLTQAPLNQSDDSEDIQFVGFGPSPEKVQPTQQVTYDLGLVKQETEPVLQKKRGRPRKIITPPEIGHSVGQSIPPGLSAKDILAASLQHQTLQQHIQQLQSPMSIVPSEEQECSSTMFPVPLFDLSEDTFMDPTPPTVFPEQVQPQTILRSARGRPIGRSRRSRGSGLLRTSERGGPRGRPRGSRGIKRMLEEMEALSYQDVDEHITLDNIDSEIGPRIPEHSGSQITEKTIALLRKSIEGKREGIEKRARKSDSGDDKNRDSDLDAQVREMKEKIEAAYQAELKFPGKEGKKRSPEKGEVKEKKGPPELIPLQKGNTPDKKVKVSNPSSEDVSFRKLSTDGSTDSFHGVGKESLKRKFDEENTEHSFENIKRKSTEDIINENKQQGSSQDQSESEILTTEDNSLKESLKESEDGDTMDVDQPVSPEEPEQVVEVKSEPEPPPKPVKPRPKSKAEIKRIKREKDRIRREAKKLAALEALKLAPPPNPFEEDTRMSATDPNGEGIDDPLGSGIKKNRMEVGDPEGKEFTVDQIAEYQWPLQGGELYMIQEQISTYLGVKSFKRKYPDLKRRPVEMEERTFLCDSGLVSESMCDLGLTAVSSSEVLDIMFQDFQEQYEELRKHMREKQARELINKQKERKKFELSLSKSDLKEQAIQSAVSWNSQLNRSRSESRRCHLDLQTWTIQYPRSRGSKMTRPTPRLGNYPVALIPGQYADFYKRYTAQELRYWPVNTVLYGPLQPNERHSTGGSDGSQSESEDSSSSDDSSDSSSDGEGEGTCEEEEKGCKACGGKRGGEALVQCSQCGHNIHVSCADLNPAMLVHVRKYPWQCSVCKTCQRCNNAKNESKMLFCDVCDRGFHSYCVGLRRVPQGSWTCSRC